MKRTVRRKLWFFYAAWGVTLFFLFHLEITGSLTMTAKIFIAQKSYFACCILSLATIRSKCYFNFILNRSRSGRELFDRSSYFKRLKSNVHTGDLYCWHAVVKCDDDWIHLVAVIRYSRTCAIQTTVCHCVTKLQHPFHVIIIECVVLRVNLCLECILCYIHCIRDSTMNCCTLPTYLLRWWWFGIHRKWRKADRFLWRQRHTLMSTSSAWE